MTQTSLGNRRTWVFYPYWLILSIMLIMAGTVVVIKSGGIATIRPEDGATLWPAWKLNPSSADTYGKTEYPESVPASASILGEKWQTVRVRPGDTLSSIFDRLGISPQLLHSILSLGEATAALEKIHPGQLIKLKFAEQSSLIELMYDIDPTRSLRVWQADHGFSSSIIQHVVDRRVVQSVGIITHSLFEDGAAAGLSDGLILKLAEIFGYNIDFAQDLRAGDRFKVVYDDIYVAGQRLHTGDILAAEFVNQGTVYKAVRYTDPSGDTGYYTPNGTSLHRAFLRTPVAFTRISSGFSLARYHPILNTIRAHKGVDYAAPIGTPVRATSNGKVVFVGDRGGYGKAIELDHGGGYSTFYAHLSRYGNIQTGSHVWQGQVIGYVGQTGLATGPHLHYEFRINGVHHDPLTVKLPAADPIQAKYKQDFMTASRPLLAKLQALDDANAVALNVSPSH